MWERTAAQLKLAIYCTPLREGAPHTSHTAAAALRPRFHMCPGGTERSHLCACTTRQVQKMRHLRRWRAAHELRRYQRRRQRPGARRTSYENRVEALPLQPTPPLPLPQARASAGKCTACDAGKYKAGSNTDDCSVCAAGKFSPGNAAGCTNCGLPDNADDRKCVDSSIGDVAGIAREFIIVTRVYSY